MNLEDIIRDAIECKMQGFPCVVTVDANGTVYKFECRNEAMLEKAVRKVAGLVREKGHGAKVKFHVEK